MSFGVMAVRATVGPLFVGHGAQKLFGWFGGHGVEGTGAFFESLGLRPGRRHAAAAGAAEMAGGALLTLGALTPLAGTLLSSTMITAMRTAHAGKGPWTTSGGWEYNAVVVAVATALADRGPGRPSVDARFFPRLHGPVWAALSLGAALAGSHLATAAGSDQPPADASRDEAEGRFTRPGEAATDAAAAPEAAEVG